MQTPTHSGLKSAVIAAIFAIAVVAWLSFWWFGQPAMRLPAFIAQLWQPQSPVFWQWSRILGVLSYVTLWLSVMTGLSISSQTSSYWFERGTALSWHQFFTWVGLTLGLLHTAILLQDAYLSPSLAALLIPFNLHHLQLPRLAWVWAGLGQVAWYGMAVIAVGSLLKQKRAKTVWRYLHAFALFAYLAVVAHGLFMGTDSQQLWLKTLYLGSNIVLVSVVMLRVVQLKFPVLKRDTASPLKRNSNATCIK